MKNKYKVIFCDASTLQDKLNELPEEYEPVLIENIVSSFQIMGCRFVIIARRSDDYRSIKVDMSQLSEENQQKLAELMHGHLEICEVEG